MLRSCDVALPALHGPHGEDGTLAAVCASSPACPYVGSGVGAGAIAMDKWVTKLVAEAIGVATAAGRLLTAATAPCVLRGRTRWWSSRSPRARATASAWCGSRPSSARHSRRRSRSTAGSWSRTSSIGREIDIAVLGRPDGERIVSPPLEIVVDGLFDHDTKYGGHADFRIPAALDDVGRQGARRTPRSPSSTRSAAPASPGSTSS